MRLDGIGLATTRDRLAHQPKLQPRASAKVHAMTELTLAYLASSLFSISQAVPRGQE